MISVVAGILIAIVSFAGVSVLTLEGIAIFESGFIDEYMERRIEKWNARAERKGR